MNPLNRLPASTVRFAAAGAVLFLLCGSAVSASDTRIDFAQAVAVRPDGAPNTIMERDVFAMGGDDLNRWPYIEHSSSNGDIQGINLMVPDKSRWGWRFISRITDTNVTVRAQIDVDGNAIFNGSVYGKRALLSGIPGQDTPAALAFGNHLGGDAMSTLFSSSTIAVDGVAAQVFGVSYAGTPVIAQDASGNLGIKGRVTAAAISAKALQVGRSTILSGSGAPSVGCSAGDLYVRTDGTGATLYTCLGVNTWSSVGSRAPAALSPQFAEAPFSSRALSSGNPTMLGAATMTLGTSAGAKKDWFVCSIVEATTQADGNGHVAFGIATNLPGNGIPFRMYSRPRQDAKNDRFGDGVLSDWGASSNEETNGRYCNTYENGSNVAFTAYALATAGSGIYTSGQLEIQATPQ